MSELAGVLLIALWGVGAVVVKGFWYTLFVILVFPIAMGEGVLYLFRVIAHCPM